MYKKRKKIDFALVIDGGNGGTADITDPETDETVLTGVLIDTTTGQVPSARDPTSASKSVLGEVIEAFGEISSAFSGLASSFNTFGQVIETEAGNLGTRIKESVNEIKIDIDNVVSKFGNIGKNLAGNLEI